MQRERERERKQAGKHTRRKKKKINRINRNNNNNEILENISVSISSKEKYTPLNFLVHRSDCGCINIFLFYKRGSLELVTI